MPSISKAHLWLLNALKVCSGLVIFGVFVVIVADVALTLLANWGVPVLPWDRTHGLVEYGLLWFTMLGAPWLARIKGHVFIDAAFRLLPPSAQRIAAKLVYLVVIVGCSAFTYYSVELFLEAFAFQEMDERGADFLLWTLYLPMPLCFALVAVEFLRLLVGIDDLYASRSGIGEGV